jgi:outer membrane protein assembly factor BamB
MRYAVGRALIVGALSMLVVGTAAQAQDWPHWRGPNYDGISAETGLETVWESGPPKVWERAIGSAFSAISCVDGKVYTCGTQAKQQVLFCLDADTGEVLWQKAIEKEFRETSGGDGTRATPTVDDGRVYILGALGRLVCFDAKDGNEIWSQQFNGKPQWGYAASVLIEGDLAIATAGGNRGALVALDKETGKTVWECGSGLVGYATPYALTFDGRRYVVGFLGKKVIIADLKTGREVWSMPWETDWDVNASTPIFHDGQLFLSSGYKHGATLLKLARTGEKLTTQTVWENKNIRAKFQTPVLYEGHLYGGDETELFKCIEFATGEPKWRERTGPHGTVVVADGCLFVLTGTGALLIGQASPSGFEPTTKAQILHGKCWTVPTLYRGRIYARNFEKVVCHKLTR